MKVLHLCNTFFEQELKTNLLKPLEQHFRSHKVISQLQFLPLLYANPNDSIGVSDLPDELSDPRLVKLDEVGPTDKIETWGPSLSVARWAEERNIPYPLNWDLVREINSKAFSFTQSPKLLGAELLHSETELKSWIDRTPGPKVVKTCYGTAGRGHFHIGSKPLPNEFPLIGEPWVERTFDFSTQWNDGRLLGATPFENDSRGTYKRTFAGPGLFTTYQWALDQHLEIATPLVQQICKMGYRGNLGIDAFVYRSQNREHLHPVVEINARKTMSWVALQIQQNQHPDQILEFSFTKGGEGPLPQKILGKILPHQIVMKFCI